MHKVLGLVLLGLSGVLLAACSPCASLLKGKNVGTGQIGKPLTVGDAKYTVTSASKQPFIQTGATQRRPDGVYVVVDFIVENTSKSTQRFKITMVGLEDGKARSYSYKVLETSLLTGKGGYSNPTLADVQPGASSRFLIVYDVAVDATGLKLNVKDFTLVRPAEGQIDLGI